jgi:hypothetical protein
VEDLVERGVEAVLGKVDERAAEVPNARVADEHVEPTKGLLRGAHGAMVKAQLANVPLEDDDAIGVLLFDVLESLSVAVSDDDASAFFDEAVDDRPTEARGAARHIRDLFVEPQHG